jgi:uncharacterized protein YraI
MFRDGRRVAPAILVVVGAGLVMLVGWLTAGLPGEGGDRADGAVALMFSEGGEGRVIYDGGLPPDDGAVRNYVTAARWEHNPVTYSFINCPRAINCGQAHQVVREAVEAWDAVSGITLNEVNWEGDIRIGWFSGEHGDGNPFDGPGNILAHTFFPVPWLGDLAGDLHFDDDEKWVLHEPTADDEFHLKTVAMHEAGHALGMDHSSDPSALMWEEYEGVRELGADDIAGIQALYGPPNEDDGVGGGEPLPAGGVTATATTTVRLRSGPGTDYAAVGSVPYGTSVPVLGRNAASTWIYVAYEGDRGWVAAWLCDISGDLNAVPVVGVDGGEVPGPVPPDVPSSEPPTGPSFVPGSVIAWSDSTLRMRSGPGTGYAQVGTLPAGTEVWVVGRHNSNQWLYIQYGEMRAWIAAWLAQGRGDLNTVPFVDVDGNPVPVLWPVHVGVVD